MPFRSRGWAQSHFPISLGLRRNLLRRVHETDRDIEFARKALIGIADGRAAFFAERSHHASGLGECHGVRTRPFHFVRPISDPDGKRGADRLPAVVIVIEVDPERVAGKLC